MSMTIEQITENALILTNTERAQLADKLVQSLDPADDNGFHAIWVSEAKRRRDEVRNGVVQAIPGDEALAAVRKAVGR